MGRLIDADKLRAKYKDPEDIRDSAKVLYHVTGIWAEIDAAKTVEAVPVSWIEKYIADCSVGGTVTALSAKAVNTMLEAWKEEQEASHCNADYCEIGGGE